MSSEVRYAGLSNSCADVGARSGGQHIVFMLRIKVLRRRAWGRHELLRRRALHQSRRAFANSTARGLRNTTESGRPHDGAIPIDVNVGVGLRLQNLLKLGERRPGRRNDQSVAFVKSFAWRQPLMKIIVTHP